MSKKEKKQQIYFWILIIIGIVIRFICAIKITEINSDEIVTIMNAKSILKTGQSLEGIKIPTYLNGFGGQSIMLLYLMVLSFKIFGINLISARIPSFIISNLSFFIIYDFTKKITKNKTIALIALFLVVISPWHIQQSVWALDCNLFCHVLLLAIDIFYTGIIKNNKKYIYLSLPFFIMSMYCYIVSFLFVPLFLIISLIYLKKKNILNVKDLFIFITFYCLFVMPLIITIIINIFKIKKSFSFFFFTMPYYPNLNRNDSLLILSANIFKQLLINLKYFLLLILFQIDYTSWNTSNLFGIIYHITLIFLIIGLSSCLKQKKYKFLLLYFFIIIFNALLINYVNVSKINFLWYPYIIISSIGIFKVFNNKLLIIKSIYLIFFIAYIVTFFNIEFKNIIYNDNFSNGFYNCLKYTNKLSQKKVYYDNINKDKSLKLYISFLNNNKKKYYEIKNKNELLEKYKNLQSNELIIIKYHSIKNTKKYKKIGNYVIVHK